MQKEVGRLRRDKTEVTDSTVVVGGGIGGMATALALSQQGRRVHLLEQANEFGEVGAGLQVGPNVMKIFERLGILDQVKKIAFFPENLILMDALDASEVVRVRLDQGFRSRFGQPYATIHRADLHAVLTDACRATDLVSLHTGTKVVAYEQSDDGVIVYTEDGTIYRGDVLIGADGIRSTVRSALLDDGPPRITGHIAYRAVVAMEAVPENLRSNSVVLWAGPNMHLAHYPVRGGELFNVGAIFHSRRYEEGSDTFGDPEELHERFQGVCPEVETLLGMIEEWRMWVLRDREPAERWTDGRVALLGDAAHPTLQYLAQGAGMAVEDAFLLADRMTTMNDMPAALRSYQSARSVRTARVTLMSRLYGELYHASGVARSVRKQMLNGWPNDAAQKSFAWLYDGIA